MVKLLDRASRLLFSFLSFPSSLHTEASPSATLRTPSNPTAQSITRRDHKHSNPQQPHTPQGSSDAPCEGLR